MEGEKLRSEVSGHLKKGGCLFTWSDEIIVMVMMLYFACVNSPLSATVPKPCALNKRAVLFSFFCVCTLYFELFSRP